MAPEILTEIFSHKERNYILRKSTALEGRSIKAVMHGSETCENLWMGPKKLIMLLHTKHWISVSYLYTYLLFCFIHDEVVIDCQSYTPQQK